MLKKNSRKGFTLIELLAVILILGIIALIAIPTVTNIINVSKKSAFEVSANNVVAAVENECSIQALKGQAITTTYIISDGVIYPTIKIKGDIPQTGQLTVNSSCQVAAELNSSLFAASKTSAADAVTVVSIKGYSVTVSLVGAQSVDKKMFTGNYTDAGATALDTNSNNLSAELSVKIKNSSGTEVSSVSVDAVGTYSVIYSITKYGKTYSITRTVNILPAPVYANGTAIYFNPVTNTKCTSASAVSTTGTKTGCMKWYAFTDTAVSDTVDLILDHNTTAVAAWNSTNSNVSGPTNVLTQLASDTSSWSSSLTVPTKYNISQKSNSGSSTYTLNYTGYKARLISVDEIAIIVGNASWKQANTGSALFYFDSKTSTASSTCQNGNITGCKYGWLYDRAATDCKAYYGCYNNSESNTNGFWTSSAVSSGTNTAWYVYRDGKIANNTVANATTAGVRPVITILKTLIS